jgi:hypothetical protein
MTTFNDISVILWPSTKVILENFIILNIIKELNIRTTF